jgi:hypothetical protein
MADQRFLYLKKSPILPTLNKTSSISKKAEILERNAKSAVQAAISEMKAKGVPIARYDAVKNKPYLEFPDGSKQYYQIEE